MNKHTKIAFVVAPFLAVFGYIASDIYLDSKAKELTFYELEPEAGFCDVIAKNCILRAGDFKLSVYDENGITTVNSTFPLDTATLFLVDDNDNPEIYRMGMKDSPYYWYRDTPFRKQNSQAGSKQKMRIVATVKGSQYISEFYSKTMGKGI